MAILKRRSLKKSKHTLFTIYKRFKKKKSQLDDSTKEDFDKGFRSLQNDILAKNADKAKEDAHYLTFLSKEFLRKTPWESIRDFIIAILIALAIAVCVRSMWFEFYEIPTGSMRPTFQEKDRLLVSKTNFGINIPLSTGHFYFDPKLTERNGTFIFTGANMDIPNVDTLYFYIFPGKKQYVKRLMGKPGDTLYFYGGKLYGIDQEGNDITSELNPPLLKDIHHVPYLSFEGRVETPNQRGQGIISPVVLYQMNEPVAKMSVTSYGMVQGDLLGKFQKMENYSNIFGFRNFGMARLLNKPQMEEFAPDALKGQEESPLYLEIFHSPDLKTAKLGRDLYGRLRPMIGLSKAYLPLKEQQIRRLFQNIYTARFVVKDQKAYRYGLPKQFRQFGVSLAQVPDGTYEYMHGKAYKILWQGIAKLLPDSHPLNQFSIYKTQLLYNVGMEFDVRYLPRDSDPNLFPSRYVYFQEGDLYSMNAPFVSKVDLESFIQNEQTKKYPFIDYGPPMKDGELDIDFIKKYGVHIPEKHYMGLGDNYANSADSREFGFIPQANIRGVPSLIFWPPGNRFGAPLQPSYPWITLPRIIVWIAAIAAMILWTLYKKKREPFPIDFESD